MDRQRLIAVLALCASVLAFGVIGLGAFTRLMDAGLGCPDWPGCFGHLTVPMTEKIIPLVAYKAWAEMIHRYFAGTLSLLIIAIVILVFKNGLTRREKKANFWLVIALLLLLVYQIILGQWTVTLKLLPIVVTQHLLGGFLILSVLWLIYLHNKPMLKIPHSAQGLLPWAVIAVLILLAQIALGAWTSTHYAALSCADFPFCSNDHPFLIMHFKQAFTFFSPLGVNYEGGILSESVRQTIQMTHRIGALLVTIYLIIFAAIALAKLKFFPTLLHSLYLILGLLMVQLCLGMANVIFKLPLVTAIGHTLVAALLLLSVITLVFKLVSSRVSSS